MKKTIPDNVLDVIKTSRIDGSKLHLPGQLDRKLYTDTMKVIEMLGGRWDKKTRAHIFDDDCGERIEEAVMTGEVTDHKKLFQFFATPADVARRMVRRLNWDGTLRVLEPSAGRGSLIRAMSGTALGGNSAIWWCELDPKNREALERDFPYATMLADDFMKLEVNGYPFDRIVMNPPFRNGQDVRHVRKAFEHLSKGGQMVAIMSPAFEFRDTELHRDFREFLNGTNHDIDHLDAGEFSESGTEIRTVMVTLWK